MSITREERRRATAFVIGALLLLGASFGVIGLRRLWRDERRYRVVFSESVSGLEQDSVVEYKGVPIGVVRDVRLSPDSLDRVVVELAIDARVPIKADTRARLRVRGITGMLQLELVGGTPDAPELEEDGAIEADPSLLVTLETALRDLADLTKGLSGARGDAEALLADVRRTVNEIGAAARTFDASIAAIGSQVEQNGTALRRVLDDPATRALPGETREALQAFQAAARELQAAAAGVGRLAAGNQDEVRAALADLRRASADIRATARRVKSSPSSLLVGQPLRDKEPRDPLPEEDE